MLLSLAILLFTFPTVTAQTDLQAKCTGNDRLYNGSSCYVVVGTAKTHNEAKTSCNHYLGNSGHLVNIKSSAAQSAVRTLITNYATTTVTYVWTCLELLNSSAATSVSSNWGNYFRGGTLDAKAVYLPWYTTEPQLSATSNRVVYNKASNYIHSVPLSSAYSYVCEYEEALREPVVTDLEQKCVNLTSSFKTLFLNDICYVAHP
uniref:C-type lectin domain-containing protein n=1 Tax=Plectus sambesii TaxID=2011161 RepID=A0A914XK11_9BILA